MAPSFISTVNYTIYHILLIETYSDSIVFILYKCLIKKCLSINSNINHYITTLSTRSRDAPENFMFKIYDCNIFSFTSWQYHLSRKRVFKYLMHTHFVFMPTTTSKFNRIGLKRRDWNQVIYISMVIFVCSFIATNFSLPCIQILK